MAPSLKIEMASIRLISEPERKHVNEVNPANHLVISTPRLDFERSLRPIKIRGTQLIVTLN